MVSSFLNAAKNGNHRQLLQKLKNGAYVNEQDDSGNTAIMLSCINGNAACVKILMEWDADTTMENDYGATALTMAKRHEGCKALLMGQDLPQEPVHTSPVKTQSSQTQSSQTHTAPVHTSQGQTLQRSQGGADPTPLPPHNLSSQIEILDITLRERLTNADVRLTSDQTMELLGRIHKLDFKEIVLVGLYYDNPDPNFNYTKTRRVPVEYDFMDEMMNHPFLGTKAGYFAMLGMGDPGAAQKFNDWGFKNVFIDVFIKSSFENGTPLQDVISVINSTITSLNLPEYGMTAGGVVGKVYVNFGDLFELTPEELGQAATIFPQIRANRRITAICYEDYVGEVLAVETVVNITQLLRRSFPNRILLGHFHERLGVAQMLALIAAQHGMNGIWGGSTYEAAQNGHAWNFPYLVGVADREPAQFELMKARYNCSDFYTLFRQIVELSTGKQINEECPALGERTWRLNHSAFTMKNVQPEDFGYTGKKYGLTTAIATTQQVQNWFNEEVGGKLPMLSDNKVDFLLQSGFDQSGHWNYRNMLIFIAEQLQEALDEAITAGSDLDDLARDWFSDVPSRYIERSEEMKMRMIDGWIKIIKKAAKSYSQE